MKKQIGPVNIGVFRQLIALFTGHPLVALVDHDGYVSVRLGRRDSIKRLWAPRMSFGIRNVTLLQNGAVSDGGYVIGWFLVRPGWRDKGVA